MAVDTYALITLAALKTELGITALTYDTLLEDSIDRATGTIESYCRRKLKSRRFYEWHDAGGQAQLRVKNTPLSSVYYVGYGNQLALTVSSTIASDVAVLLIVEEDRIRLARRASNGTETATSLLFTTYNTAGELATAIAATTGYSATVGTDCPAQWIRRIGGRDLKTTSCLLYYPDRGDLDAEVDADRGILNLHRTLADAGLPRGSLSVLIEYDGGYVTVPYDLERAAIMLATRYYYGRQRDTGVTSQSIGDYSETIAVGDALNAEVKELLSPYRRLR